MDLAVGIDVGSVAVKAMALAAGSPVAWLEEPTRPDASAQCERVTAELVARCGPQAAVGDLCATGYGRNLVPGATTSVSEIMANATGAAWLADHWGELAGLFGAPPDPERLDGPFRTIVDVGGQDSKVITFDTDGMIRDFAMNDRCAAGTGRFLEVMARVLEVDLARLDALALQARSPASISSACTVFAESEVVSLLAEGASPQDVAAGVFDSVAGQVAGLAMRSGCEAPVLFDGGPSNSRALRAALAGRLGSTPAVVPCGQFATALGAALVAQSNS